MTTASARREPAPRRATAASQICAVRLVDRRTGTVHRINGTPLVILTRDPQEAAAELLDGRDPGLWEARIDTMGTGGRR